MPFPLSTIIWILAALAIAAVGLWALNAWPGMDATIKAIMRIVIIVFVSVWVIYLLAGLLAGLPALPHR